MFFVFTATAGPSCGFVPPPARAVVPILANTDGSGELQLRDAFGDFETEETERFAIKWGPDYTPDPSHLARLEEDLAVVWETQVEELGWLPPTGSESFKLNVYLGSTGGAIPRIDFSGGYVTVDDQGYPYIVLSTDSLLGYDRDHPDFRPIDLVAHEFNHTLQIRNQAFMAGRYGPFLWEATASWIVPQSLGGEPPRGWGRFLLNPHVSLDMHALWDDDDTREARQYDTALFLHYLTDQYGLGHDFIRDAWIDGVPEDEPLVYLDAALPGGLAPVFTDFAVSYALGTHDLAELYDEGAHQAADWGTPDNETAASVPAHGTNGFDRPSNRRRPQAYAWNRVAWNVSGDGTAAVRFEPDAVGTRDTPSDLQAFVAHRSGDALTMVDLDTPLDVAVGDRIELIVVSTPENAAVDERFGYQYAFDVDIVVPAEPEDRGPVREVACGCSARGSSTVGFFGMLVWLLVLRRR